MFGKKKRKTVRDLKAVEPNGFRMTMIRFLSQTTTGMSAGFGVAGTMSLAANPTPIQLFAVWFLVTVFVALTIGAEFTDDEIRSARAWSLLSFHETYERINKRARQADEEEVPLPDFLDWDGDGQVTQADIVAMEEAKKGGFRTVLIDGASSALGINAITGRSFQEIVFGFHGWSFAMLAIFGVYYINTRYYQNWYMGLKQSYTQAKLELKKEAKARELGIESDLTGAQLDQYEEQAHAQLEEEDEE